MSEENKATATMDQFFTRQRANEGVTLPLYLPDGTPTSHSIKIRGVDSDIFKAAEAESSRRLMDMGLDLLNNKEALTRIVTEEKQAVIAALVISWTFEKPCTLENVKELFREAPQIAEQVDRLASKRSLFFKFGSMNSSPSPAQSSS